MKMTIPAATKQGRPQRHYSYEACGQEVLSASGNTVDCPRPEHHDGECKPTIPFADFRTIATSNPEPTEAPS